MFQQTHEIRFNDEDSQGHVNHEAFVSWIAAARIKFIDEMIAKAEELDIDHVLVKLGMEFNTSVNYPGEIEVQVFVSHIGNKSLRLGYNVVSSFGCIAKASSTSVFTKEIPQQLRVELEKFRD